MFIPVAIKYVTIRGIEQTSELYMLYIMYLCLLQINIAIRITTQPTNWFKREIK